ncbi:hypothetical protein [Pseudoalteromonas denitrificans]|uniref:Uncharacterized protein n=1 Tax=Pseudoalteromonas denitrificans DSM 6059 TaxID=1123010 RepID=A0A1I1SAS5_9GAMM|nr:hypothetical protein [Pseudoalteromonas denitrificans]SFD43614.1 hypothetical protein SAMN02745724_04520 [Pseudoalteromonas denitrificans DSM 6059]
MFLKKVLISATFVCLSFSALSSTSGKESQVSWQPVASDKLIRLPVNIIEKRIEQDFNMSPMASRVSNIEKEMLSTVDNMKTIGEQLANAQDDDLLDKRHDLLQQKSHYLDLLQESQALRQRALATKQDLYLNILDKIVAKNESNTSSLGFQLRKSQKAARARMEKMITRVDQHLVNGGYDEASPYATEYATNLDKINQLKNKISKHSANKSPTLNGVEVTSQEYLRQLLIDVSSEQSLLDQEGLLLSYMARLVALDANEMEYQMSYGSDEMDVKRQELTSPSTVADLFL